MKIHGSLPLSNLDAVQRHKSDAVAAQKAAPAEQVQLEGGAKFIQDVRELTASTPDVRLDEVARARSDVASGEIFSESELDATVDVLLAGV